MPTGRVLSLQHPETTRRSAAIASGSPGKAGSATAVAYRKSCTHDVPGQTLHGTRGYNPCEVWASPFLNSDVMTMVTPVSGAERTKLGKT